MKNFGYIEAPIEAGKDYILGGFNSLGGIPLVPSGDWTAFLPTAEFQNPNGIEPQACVSFSTLSAVETLLGYYGKKVDRGFSDRWLSWASGTTAQGNTLAKVCEALRKAGTPNEDRWPADHVTTFEEWYQTPPPALYKSARDDFLNLYSFYHEYVPTETASLKFALQFSPLVIAVSAWYMGEDGIYTDMGAPANHAVLCYGYDESKKAWKLFDSYQNEYKLYNGKITQAKRFKLVLTPTKTPFQAFLDSFFSLLASLKQWGIPTDDTKANEAIKTVVDSNPLPPPDIETPQERLLEASYKALGRDITPRDTVDDEYACASSLSTLLNDVFGNFPHITYTPTLYEHLNKDPRFQATLDLEPGCIIVSPTIPGNIYPGHTGVIANRGFIHSNESRSGLWAENFTMDSWIRRYRTIGKMKIRVFKPKL